MSWAWDAPVPAGRGRYGRAPTLEPHVVTFVRVCGFTFEFHSREQLELCAAYYGQKVLPTSRLPVDRERIAGSSHGSLQRWFERLPLRLRAEPKRLRVERALRQALDAWAAE